MIVGLGTNIAEIELIEQKVPVAGDVDAMVNAV